MWAAGELKKLMPSGMMAEDDILQLVGTLIYLDPVSINEQLANFIDFTKKEVKAFISEFIDRLETQRKYEEQVKTVQTKTDNMAKKANTQKHTKRVQQRDLSKIKPTANRKICYC